VKSYGRRALSAAIVVFVCAAIAAACDSSSPVEVQSTFEAGGRDSWLEASPVTVDLGSSSTNASITLKSTSRRKLSWSASENASWLTLGTTTGTLRRGSSKKISLSVQRTGLAAGDYTGDVTITSNRGGTETVRVKMNVSGSGSTAFTVSPLQLDFGSTATSLAVTLKNTSSKSVAWTATESAGWLGLSSASGTIAANSQKTVTVTVSRSRKDAGTYSRNINFAAGTAGSATVRATMTVPSTSSGTGTTLLAGQLVNQFTGSAMAGITVQFEGKSAVTNSSGMFTLTGTAVSSLQQLTLLGSGIYKRVTFAKTGDSKWGVVPASFGMSAFNDVARDEFGSSTIRWVARPTVYVDSRPEGFTSTQMSTWVSEIKVQATDFISRWSNGAIRPASVIVTSSPPSDLSSGTIVIHVSDNNSDFGGSSTMIGYARTSYDSDRSIRGAAVWLRYIQYADRPSKRKGILGHELGHAMGLGHMGGETISLMEPSIGSKTGLNEFDVQVASLLYSRSPGNTSADNDDSGTFLGLAPSAAPIAREWMCDAGSEPASTR
jgi:hypothetical protein